MTKVQPLNIQNRILDKNDNISFNTNINCSICIDEIDIKDNENTKIIDCSNKHIFHTVCINKWLKVNNICPLCRENIKIENSQSTQTNNQTDTTFTRFQYFIKIMLIITLFTIAIYSSYYLIQISNFQSNFFDFYKKLNNLNIEAKYFADISGLYFSIIFMILFHIIYTIYFVTNKYSIILFVIFFDLIFFGCNIYYIIDTVNVIKFYKENVINQNDLEYINKIYREYMFQTLCNWAIIILYYIFAIINYLKK